MFILFLIIGLAIGSIGTLVGAGGGFLAMPILLFLFHLPPAVAAGTSLLMVTMNALSGTVAYWRQGKIHLKTGLLLTIAAYPGSALGALLAANISQQLFNIIFGIVYVVLAIWMFVSSSRVPSQTPKSRSEVAATREDVQESGNLLQRMFGHRMKVTFNVPGLEPTEFHFKTYLAILIAFVTGLQASLMGVGGGPLLVPALIFILGFPAHMATAVSQFTIAASSILALGIYMWHGHIQFTSGLAMGVGAIIGAPLGVWLASRISGKKLVYILSLTLLGVGVKMLI